MTKKSETTRHDIAFRTSLDGRTGFLKPAGVSKKSGKGTQHSAGTNSQAGRGRKTPAGTPARGFNTSARKRR